MEAMDMKKKLAQKITDVAKDIGKMEKDGQNTYSGYGYISSEAMLTKLREILPKHNLSIIPSITGYEETTFNSGKDKTMIRTVVNMDNEIVDLETGYSIVCKAVGADQDVGGKSCGQAITEAYKRWLFKLFLVTSSDEIDPDSKTPEIKKTPLKKTSAKALFMAKALEAGYDKKEVADLANKTFNNDPSEENVQKWLDAGNEIVGKDEFYAE